MSQATGRSLSGSTADLALIQKALDARIIEPNDHYGWWMVEDGHGRDPAIRFKETTLLVFPQTMISKRVEDAEVIEVNAMYEGLCEQLEDIRAKNYPNA